MHVNHDRSLVSLVSLVSLALALPAAVGAGCSSSSGGAGGPTPDGGCVPGDASVTALLAVNGGPAACRSLRAQRLHLLVITACGSDWVYNRAGALQAVSCLENLGTGATLATATACVTSIPSSSEPTLEQVGTCLASCECVRRGRRRWRERRCVA